MSFIVQSVRPNVIAGDPRDVVLLGRQNARNNIERVKERRPVINLVPKQKIIPTKIKGLKNTGYDPRNLILQARRKEQQQRFNDNANLKVDQRNFSKIYFQ